MDIFDKAGKAVGDVVAKARERERIRIQDRLRLLTLVEATARMVVMNRKHRAGYTWDTDADNESMKLIAAAEGIDDEELTTLADTLANTIVGYEGTDAQRVGEARQLEAAYRAIVRRLGIVRRETLADD